MSGSVEFAGKLERRHIVTSFGPNSQYLEKAVPRNTRVEVKIFPFQDFFKFCIYVGQ